MFLSFTCFFSGLASPAEFKSSPEGDAVDRFSLEWVAESRTAVTAFRVQYKELHESVFIDVGVVRPRSENGHAYYGEADLTGLRKGTLYEARVASENVYGFSEFGPSFVFGTRGSGQISQRDKSCMLKTLFALRGLKLSNRSCFLSILFPSHTFPASNFF